MKHSIAKARAYRDAETTVAADSSALVQFKAAVGADWHVGFDCSDAAVRRQRALPCGVACRELTQGAAAIWAGSCGAIVCWMNAGSCHDRSFGADRASDRIWVGNSLCRREYQASDFDHQALTIRRSRERAAFAIATA
jgi:hypothetical protein